MIPQPGLVDFGGRYVAEALFEPLEEVAALLRDALEDEVFLEAFDQALATRVGRPTPLTPLWRLASTCGEAALWLKREDLCAGGSFCANLATFQAMLALRGGRREVITESATGDFGVALASAAASLGLHARVFMGREDAHAEPRNVARMRRMGAEVVLVDATRRERGVAQAEAMRAWRADPSASFYTTSSLATPEPYPQLIERALQLIGAELLVQLRRLHITPTTILAPMGTGGFAAGVFAEFLGAGVSVELVAVASSGDTEPAPDETVARVLGQWGIHRGTSSLVRRGEGGVIVPPATSSAGLATAVVGPQHARWAASRRVSYQRTSDQAARDAVARLAREEGVLVNQETGHALAAALERARHARPDAHLIVATSGSAREES